MSEVSLRLGTNGIWVDHLTTLDPHPLNNDGFFDFIYSAVDASVQTYESVLFHDNYWQDDATLIYGEPVYGAYIRKLIGLCGGNGGCSGSPGTYHANVHLWYHGTMDMRNPANDTEAQITNTEFGSWYAPYENFGFNAGFKWSLIGRGDRTSPDRPVAAGSAIRDGYNQTWNLGAGQNGNRTFLPANNGRWPNVIKLNLVGTNMITVGESNAVNIYYQWAQPTSSTGTLSFFLDDDFNPYNGNEKLLRRGTILGTGANGVSHFPVAFGTSATNAAPGDHTIYAQISAGGRTRYLYAPEILRVLPAAIPPFLTGIARVSSTEFSFSLNGSVGANYTIQASTNLNGSNWFNLSSLSLTSSPMYLRDNQATNQQRFYRAQKN